MELKRADLTFERRRELKEQISEARRKAVSGGKKGPYSVPRRRTADGRKCQAILGPFSARPGEKCGRVPRPGEKACGLHLSQMQRAA